MGDFNPNSPSIIGIEDYLNQVRTIDLTFSTSAMAMRCNPGAVTPTGYGVFAKTAVNDFQGVEIQSTLLPQILSEIIFPGTNTGAFATGWQDETGVTGANFAKVNKLGDDSTYLTSNQTVVAVGAQTSPGIGYHASWNRGGMNDLAFRGARAATYTAGGLRVVSVQVVARISAPTSQQFSFGMMVPGGTQLDNFISPAFKGTGAFANYQYTIPGDPWAMGIGTAAAQTPFWSMPHISKTWDDVITTAAPLVFGIIPVDPTGVGGGNGLFKVSGLCLFVNYCTENRVACGYPRTALSAGWNKFGGGNHFAGGPRQRPVIFSSSASTTALTTPAPGAAGAGMFTSNDAGATIVRASDGQVVGTVSSVTNGTTAVLTANGASTNTNVLGYLGTAPSALSAATFYWAVQDAIVSTTSQVQMDLVKDPAKVPLAAAGSTGENRDNWALVTVAGAPYVATTAVEIPGELSPLLIYTGATPSTVNPESQPYAAMIQNGLVEIHSGQSVAQTITGGAATAYSAVKLVVSRFSATADPNAVLTVQIRHGGGALTGGGTLDATATVLVSQLDATNGAYKTATVIVPFTAFTSILSTQYVVYLTSAAASGKGWAVSLLDTRSDAVTNVTLADVEGASVGGQTDSYINSAGTALTRYDAAASLLGPPTAPSGFTAKAVAAT